jgi:hypothetical protein
MMKNNATFCCLNPSFSLPLGPTENVKRKAHAGFCWLKPEGKRPFGTPQCRWEDTKMDLQPVGWKGVDCTDLSKDRDKRRALKNAVMNFHVPQKVWNFWTRWETVSFSRSTLFHAVSVPMLHNFWWHFPGGKKCHETGNTLFSERQICVCCR